MRKLIRNNVGMKVLSVAVAILIWFLVSSSNDPVRTKRYTNIKVNMINGEKLIEGGLTYNVESGETVDIIVKGNKSVINRVSKSDFIAEADLSQLSELGTVHIHVTSSKYPDQLDINLGRTQVVRVNVEEISTKSVKVAVNPSGDPAENYVIGSTSSSPSLIEVEGPKSKVDKISGISVDMDVTDASDTIKEKISSGDFTIYDQDGEEMTSDTLSFDQESVTAKVQILKKKEIQIRLATEGDPKEGYSLASLEYEPKKMVIAGDESDVDSLTYIELDPISIEGRSKNYSDEIALTEELLEEKTGKKIQLYDDSADGVSVKAVIEKTITKRITFNDSDIEVRNNKENYVVTFDKDNDYVLTVRGASSVVNSLKIKDFEPYINLESITLPDNSDSEEHTMKFHYTEPDNAYVVSSPEGNIRIKVSR